MKIARYWVSKGNFCSLMFQLHTVIVNLQCCHFISQAINNQYVTDNIHYIHR